MKRDRRHAAEWDENEAILQSLQDDIIVTNLDGIILRASKTSGDIYDIDSADIIGRSVYDLEKEGLFTPTVTPMVIKEKKKLTFVQTTGAGKKLLVTGIPVFDQQGSLKRIVSYSHDVTELLEVKKYLKSMEEEIEKVKTELDLLRNKQFYDDGVIANSNEMKKVLDVSSQVSGVDANVLLLGESGAGKSLIAAFIHRKSPRCKGPFIEVNCGAIPASLFESELFGYEPSAFTGASRKGKLGLAELADGGTLFLDEIGELAPEHQVKLLKLIQEKKFLRVGGTMPRKVDFRLIAATNKNLRKAITERKFREDLYFRLNVVPITIPPLRDRTEDILPLIDHFLNHFTQKYGRDRKLDEAVIAHLLYYEWKGNVRELINLIERLVVTSPSSLITTDCLPEHVLEGGAADYADTPAPLRQILNDVEKQVLLHAKKQYSTTTAIGKALEISQPSVVRKLKKHGLN
ncbi:transcriptional regulator with PAS, ATPase and Fis domain [Scopulibacillus darangshiensis]|uniref:HTH-type transcriptional regulatory protein TyrR n=1 Tax=Scopulibacillus darangshiensis TaxID=442528 RepID=A0A4R2NE21_9BACL|nr:sigma 54-interacting transcriptional regulator [Scopulibacillus darangshiensis]TCP19529.1 transcriptional regulator with PAS, ATPase and Fis domain [Scopulibacillus darangshiensis]